jgi:hypothetical protein
MTTKVGLHELARDLVADPPVSTGHNGDLLDGHG